MDMDLRVESGCKNPDFGTFSFEIQRCLGSGAFGEVHLVKISASSTTAEECFQERKHGFLALKRSSLVGMSAAGVEMAKDEARLLLRLGTEHSSILQCFDFRVSGESSPELELLLEFASLGDLSSRIARARNSNGLEQSLSEAEVVSYGCDIASALSHLHSLRPKVLHRDVKPANVVLFPSREGPEVLPRAKLADFGIAKVLEKDVSCAGASTIIGTPHYLSPEMCRGEAYDERSDAWALGCVIYEMLCLHRPFHLAEGNLAVLCVRIMEGRFDRDALQKKASEVNGLLIFSLFGLLCTDADQRHRASNAYQAFAKMRNNTLATIGKAISWWEIDDVMAEASLHSPEHASKAIGISGTPTDSWRGAIPVLAQAEETILPADSKTHTLLDTLLHSQLSESRDAVEFELDICQDSADISDLLANSMSCEFLTNDLSMQALDMSQSLDDDTKHFPRESVERGSVYESPQTEFLIETVDVIENSATEDDHPCRLASVGNGMMGLLMSDPPSSSSRPQSLVQRTDHEVASRPRVLLRPLQREFSPPSRSKDPPVLLNFRPRERISDDLPFYRHVLSSPMTTSEGVLERALSGGWFVLELSVHNGTLQ